MNRYQVAGWHVIASLAVVTGLAFLLLGIWLPGFFFRLDGGWHAIALLAGVQLILGPMLTLVLYKKGKPGLGFDLTVIALLQVVALAAGLFTIINERTTFLVYYEKHFYSVSDATFGDLNLIAPNVARFGGISPAFVYAQLPSDPIEEADLRRILYHDQLPPWAYPKLYRPLADHVGTVIDESGTEAEIRALDRHDEIDPWLARYGGRFGDYAFVPVHSRFQETMLVIRRSDRSVVDVIDVPPEPGLAAVGGTMGVPGQEMR